MTDLQRTDLQRRTVLQLGASVLALAAMPAPPARASVAPASAGSAAPSPRRRERLADGWRFHLGHAADIDRDFGFGRNQRTFAKAGKDTATAAFAAFDDADWAQVRVPHDWAVDLPYAQPAPDLTEDGASAAAAHGFKAIGRDHPQHSVGWYRRTLPIDAADRGRRTWLEFDGVFRDCLVFVNGYIVGRSESGYAPFGVDISDVLDYDGGPNLLALRVDASLGEGWFYEGAGVYRHVDLVCAHPLHIPQWGTYVRAQPDGAGARVRVTTELANQGDADADVQLRQHIRSPDGAVIARLPDADLRLAAGQRLAHDADVALASAQRWSIETPQLHTLVSDVLVDGAVVDRYETPFGILSIRFDAQRGFFLNDRPVKLLGTCNHQDHAGVGTAIPDRLHEWRIEQLQSMGSNAWRSAHNPPSQALLDLCDANGMLMIGEARLNGSDPEALGQLDRMLRRDRNHPCVILWSIGNEEPHQGTPRGARISEAMIDSVRRLDPTRPTTQAFDSGFDSGASRAVDVIGFNYRTDQIAAFHARFPDQPIIGSETGSTVATRGAYANDAARHIVRAYDTEHPWWASTAEAWWRIAAEHPYIAGGFIWTGFDYRGEPTPFSQWPSISSYFGVLDSCGFAKDNYWYYRAWWRPDVPLVHLLPHWTWPGRDGEAIEVWVHGNCDEVELLLDGRSLGRKRVERNGHVAWSVAYAPGRLQARGFIGGKRVAVDERRTAGAAHAVRLTSDRPRIAGDGQDLAMLRAEIVDRAGTPVPDSDVLVRFAVAGPARIIGVGNGDPTSTEPDHAMQRTAFNGLCQAIVQSDGAPGMVRIGAEAPGLQVARLSILAVPQASPRRAFTMSRSKR